MIRGLDKLWYGLLCMAHNWILCRVEAYCRRYEAREGKAKSQGEAVHRLHEQLARQKPHLN